jgi:hypothetical protein
MFYKLALISENATLDFKVLSKDKADFENATKNLTCKLALKSDEINCMHIQELQKMGRFLCKILKREKQILILN